MPDWIDTPPEVLTLVTIIGTVMGVLFFIIDSRVRKTLAELKPNHGSSLRDAVDRIESKIDGHIQWHLEDK
jgi:uncharacterized membrane protein